MQSSRGRKARANRYWLAFVLAIAAIAGLAKAGDEADPNGAGIVALGEHLFFDARLSADGATSCASCHRPDLAFSDGLRVARGAFGKTGTRNTPTLLNVGRHGAPFWDGRRATLEAQALDPLTNSFEHGLDSPETLLSLVRSDDGYAPLFKAAYGVDRSRVTPEHVAQALAAFERTLRDARAPYDRHAAGESGALDARQVRGLELFRGRARCSECHLLGAEAAFTDNAFHGLGVGNQHWGPGLAALVKQALATPPERVGEILVARADAASLGRFVVTRDPRDIGKFKTPSLRNVELTAPYMHDGSIATLAEAVDFEIYYRSHLDNKPAVFTPEEKSDLVSFLGALTGETARSWKTRSARR
jgi:cytochrome c peroxidase